MKRMIVWTVIAGLVAMLGVSTAHAEEPGFPCDSIRKENISGQFGPYAWIQYTVETVGVFDLCGQFWVVASADVAGVGGGASTWGLMYASLRRQVPVPRYNETYTVNGVHMSTTTFPWYTVVLYSSSMAQVGPEPAPETPGPSVDMCATDPAWSPDCTPLLIDMGNNGLRLTTVAGGVLFDLDADGVKEQVAWTQLNSDDQWLVYDRNNNGKIDNGTEMFGGFTRMRFSRPAPAANGFEALKSLQFPDWGRSAVDDVFDKNDAHWGRLRVWKDANHDGVSQSTELRTMAVAGITSIKVTYYTLTVSEPIGESRIRLASKIQTTAGDRRIVDVWLATKPVPPGALLPAVPADAKLAK